MENKIQELQAVLYAHGGEMRKKELALLLTISETELASRVRALADLLQKQALELFETESTISLRTAREYAPFITELHQKGNEKDIGAAGLEVLAIVLYKGEASRATIDYIRGVNSSGTLRQLVLRGLLERIRDTIDARAWLYRATPELLAHTDVSSREDLPEYETIAAALTAPQGNLESDHE